MKCPRCETSRLDERDRDGVTIDLCPACRGIWLDRGELEKLIARAVEEEEALARPDGRARNDDHDDDGDPNRRDRLDQHEDHGRGYEYARVTGHDRDDDRSPNGYTYQADRSYPNGQTRKRPWYETFTNMLD